MKIYLNKEQSQVLIDLAIADLLPKELERLKKEKQAKQSMASEKQAR